MGRALEEALAKVRGFDAAHPRSGAPASAQQARRTLVTEAGHGRWMFVVQREACGLRDSRTVMRDYNVPGEVRRGAWGRSSPHRCGRQHDLLSFTTQPRFKIGQTPRVACSQAGRQVCSGPKADLDSNALVGGTARGPFATGSSQKQVGPYPLCTESRSKFRRLFEPPRAIAGSEAGPKIMRYELSDYEWTAIDRK